MLWFKTAKDRHIEFLQAQVAQLQNYVLMTGGGAPTGFPTWGTPQEKPLSAVEEVLKDPSLAGYKVEAQKLYTTEEEEDIEYALQEGLIDQEEATRRLKEAYETANDIDLM